MYTLGTFASFMCLVASYQGYLHSKLSQSPDLAMQPEYPQHTPRSNNGHIVRSSGFFVACVQPSAKLSVMQTGQISGMFKTLLSLIQVPVVR